MVDIVHPVVVTDAKLWSANRAGIEERKSARFSLRTFAGHSEWWCDVVNPATLRNTWQSSPSTTVGICVAQKPNIRVPRGLVVAHVVNRPESGPAGICTR